MYEIACLYIPHPDTVESDTTSTHTFPLDEFDASIEELDRIIRLRMLADEAQLSI
ncbi:hypothetical protein CSKR_201207 [Clonorchis sinensis]|uniref:Uncharacterized protein n=1 Tax=Clonorchis sinensis TaxID=79923 RepID=A0A8T1MM65_CLOSI|nr:hypothetical protein CSKR_201207 [Clonorchis sinensis]